jgi:hypothetical protein
VCRLSKWIDQCEAILPGIGLPFDFKRNESPTAQLPDTYIVYFLVDDVGATWADGKETSHIPRIQVNLFYRDKSVFLTVPDQIDSAFTDSGFTLGSVGDVPFQPDTSHYGWRRDFYYYERR